MGPHHIDLHGPSSNLIKISLKMNIYTHFSKNISRCVAKMPFCELNIPCPRVTVTKTYVLTLGIENSS